MLFSGLEIYLKRSVNSRNYYNCETWKVKRNSYHHHVQPFITFFEILKITITKTAVYKSILYQSAKNK